MITLVLCLALAACGGERLVPTPTPEPVTLRFAYAEHTFDYTALIAQFHEQHPWIQVEAVVVPSIYDDLEPYLSADSIDLFCGQRYLVQWGEEGRLRPLDDLQLSAWDALRDDYCPGAWESAAMAGQQWGIPIGLDLVVAYINLDQAQALNVALPSPDWDLHSFVATAAALNYPEGLPHAPGANLFGCCGGLETIDVALLVYAHGGTLFDSLIAPTKPTLTNPLTVEAVQWYADLYRRYRLMPTAEALQVYQYGVYEAQTQGHCDTWLGMFSQRGGRQMAYHWSFDWATLPIPHDRETFTLGDGVALFLTKSGAHPQEALLLARFLSDHAISSGRYLPPRRSLATSEAYLATLKPSEREMVPVLATDVFYPPEVESTMDRVMPLFAQAVESAMLGDMTAADALAQAQDRFVSGVR
jgi:ABC-type glycerol-3-phosphate transport system substrate-binding protein